MAKDYKKQFSQIYDKHIDKIYRYVLLKVGAKEPAEDIVAEVFTKTWKKFRTGPEIRNCSAYLYQVARAEIANYYRTGAKVEFVSVDFVPIVDKKASPEAEQTLKGDLENLQRHLREIKDDYQDVLLWYYVDGYSTKEIAAMLEKSEGAVRVMVSRALAELREKMAKKWPETLFA
ncbi:MAG: sigma-70 family RNA polymerase sigma factor [Candidatus Pacebacteria bacterium]|nr:sigma-70 family RNA polymerase sigma factor [Candidatus Paceibacterota bacterium]